MSLGRIATVDADGFIRDGDCREQFYKKRLVKSESDIISEMYDLYNSDFFGGLLPGSDEIVFEIGRFEVAGSFIYDEGPTTIKADVLNFSGYEPFRDVLLHEMAHAYVRLILQDKIEESHGPKWLEQAIRLNLSLHFE